MPVPPPAQPGRPLATKPPPADPGPARPSPPADPSPAPAHPKKKPPAGSGAGRPAGSHWPGYEVVTQSVNEFADAMGGAGDRTNRAGQAAPRIDASMGPLGGVPLVGLFYYRRVNAVAETFGKATGTLGGALTGSRDDLKVAAARYEQVEQANADAVRKAGR
nr:type VII secretion target [Sphaerisporangium rufum]